MLKIPPKQCLFEATNTGRQHLRERNGYIYIYRLDISFSKQISELILDYVSCAFLVVWGLYTGSVPTQVPTPGLPSLTNAYARGPLC